jgi:hypothetical protein
MQVDNVSNEYADDAQRVEPEDASRVKRHKQFYVLEARAFEGPHQHKTGMYEEHEHTKLSNVPKEVPLCT